MCFLVVQLYIFDNARILGDSASFDVEVKFSVDACYMKRRTKTNQDYSLVAVYGRSI